MRTHYALLLNCLVLFASCNSSATDQQGKKGDSLHTTIESAAAPNNTLQTAATRAAYSKIIKIDYQKNKEILDILPLLPDSAMATWEWKKEEREGMVRSLADNNQFADTTENFNTITKLTPNYFETSVVDGYWTASLYKVSENHYIVITNDVQGDGYKINAFEVKDQQITALSLDNLIGANPGNLLLKNNSEKCKSVISEEEMGMFTYNLSNPNLISISCYYLTKKANSDCFKGNEVILKFNKNLKRFDFIKVDWRNFKQ
ncbi:MAG: hypothetical protein P0Y49_15815 [Candidatus Pedobacter colombiensis]|uniref:Lipoprotein n=1 Tax=Candidatus Pedobacter colombiensis TaxID=3121371 RepID=A0AAJ6B7N6_9SPHI|nr:hypothetical protein [Pedobacter sp.]WEK18258.1 MAG: hypothetical protein P0Y49_15815 [Pedobacter sp.]